MITVACVNVGNYLGLGELYVERLRAMVARNISEDWNFVCIGDDDARGFRGWWSKVILFQPGRFSGRVLYLDLDGVVVGSLDELSQSKGIIDLTDWGWKTKTFGSGVMVWDAGEHSEIFTEFDATVPLRFRGDQDWITKLGGWKALPSHLCRSYRYECVRAPSAGCVHVSMHGHPKPHEITTGWVPKVWRGDD